MIIVLFFAFVVAILFISSECFGNFKVDCAAEFSWLVKPPPRRHYWSDHLDRLLQSVQQPQQR